MLEAVAVVGGHLQRSLQLAADRRTEVEQRRRGREQELVEVRARQRELGRELDELVSTVHRDEMARAQQQMRLEQIEERALEELGLDPVNLVGDYGPELEVPVLVVGRGRRGDPERQPVPFVREEQTKRLRSAERALTQLGKVNPLALEEFSRPGGAAQVPHRAARGPAQDPHGTCSTSCRRSTSGSSRSSPRRGRTSATPSTEVFGRLFPGGEGRLVLTDPSDMLTTGIEVEARPPGKKVKRLSLLSGGERSLVAVAFLVSLFKARPSPFYILDEVEAALDDTNLGRLLDIYTELRGSSQLLVITHQKRTMEVGDALYGVTMRGDGVTTVISQRLREAEPA